MPVYVKGDHEVNVSGEEAVAQFEAAGYSPARTIEKPAEKKAESPADDKAKKSAAKKSAK